MYSTITNIILTTPVFPYLWVPHCMLMSLSLRATLGHGPPALLFARQHPLSCYILAILYTFSGGLLSLILLNKPILTFLTLSNNLYSFTVVWYLMFFGPKDFLYRALTSWLLPLVPLMAAAQDWQRLGLVASGVKTILEIHPTSFLYPVVFATLKSSGFMIIKYCEQLFMTGLSRAFVLPHHATKTMVVAACLLTAQQLELLSVGYNDLFCGLVLMAICVRLATSWLFKNCDPYSGLESQVCNLVYGQPDMQEKEELKKKE
eukprot:GFUD01026524.1.p1 GENE.GFUD01026524.1~~GFUD01026524.1.p1  ORF type:complete len:261 (+),score=81.83 GFUD01026524.1:287-1069(+)